MTKEEAKKALNNTKVYVNGKSKEIQEKLFGIGFQWSVGDKNKVDHTDYPFIYMHDAIIRDGCDMEFFTGHEYKEISADDILNIKLDEEFVPKHGDIIFVKSGDSSFIEIFDSYKDDGLTNKCIWCSYYISLGVPFSVNENSYLYKDEIDEIRLANVYERNMLFYALKEKGLVWNEETKKVEKIKEEHKFKPFEKVLVRNHENHKWAPNLFWEMNLYNFRMIDFSDWGFCIPYDGNEGLIGTNNKPKE